MLPLISTSFPELTSKMSEYSSNDKVSSGISKTSSNPF
jgi:hypothetical protein